MKPFLRNLLLFAWILAITGTIISLYFSNILGYVPCVLCWYQRIALYPLVLIIPIGILLKDKKVYSYILSLSLVGLFISFYHNLLYYGFVTEHIIPCSNGVSCTTRYLDLFGFISIPLLSFLAFSAITFCMVLYYRLGKKEN